MDVEFDGDAGFGQARGVGDAFVAEDVEVSDVDVGGSEPGRVSGLVIPEAELAVTTYTGAHNDVDLAYGSLAAYVTEHALAVEGPIREYYVIGPRETPDENQWRTEIGWPIFHTGQADTGTQR